MCPSYKFPIGCAVCASCFLGLQLSASTKTHRKMVLSDVQLSPGCLETFHSHLKNLFNGTCCYHLFSNCHYFSPCLLKDLPSTNFINFPICSMSSCIPFLSLLWQCLFCWQSSGSWPVTAGLWTHQFPGTRSFSQFLGLLNEREKRNTRFPGLRTLYDNLNM